MIPDLDYRPCLSADELVRTLQALVAAERTAVRLTCRYLADLADCMEDGACDALAGYADVYHAARCLFGLGAHGARERIRVGRALRSLPRIEDALISGELSYSRAREVTRVATAEDESSWLDLARDLPIRTLERRVAEAAGAAGAAGEGPQHQTPDPAHFRWSSPETVQVTLSLPAEAWALLQRAMEGARRASESSLSDSEALAAVARDALAQQNEGVESTDPRNTVVLYECPSCARAEVDTGAGAVELPDGAAAALGCGARVRDLRTEGRIVRRGGPLPAAIERAVRLRDRNTCRVSGCLRRRYVDVHHIVFRSDGGEHSRKNCVCLCTTHHGLLHDGRLQIEGDAEGELTFRDESGALIGMPAASHGGTFAVANVGASGLPAASHSGTSAGVELSASAEAARLLAVMGQRGGWSVDELVDASGLRVSVVLSTLLCLELDGRVQRDVTDSYAPIASCGNGAPIGSSAASPGGTSAVARMGASDLPASHGGTSVVARMGASDLSAAHGGTPVMARMGASDLPASPGGTSVVARMGASDAAARLLAVMGRRGGWSVDELVEASGLRVSVVSVTLLGLELDGQVQCDATGSYARSAGRGGTGLGQPRASSSRACRGLSRTGDAPGWQGSGPGRLLSLEDTASPRAWRPSVTPFLVPRERGAILGFAGSF